jgi:outer membrane protein assembly factor BamB
VGALDGNLYCLDANSGSVTWKFQTGGPIQATPTIVDNAVYVASSTPVPDGTLYKLDASDGSVIWNVAIPYVLDRSGDMGHYLFASPTVGDGKVFVRSGLYMNYALDATTGETIWACEARINPGTSYQAGGVIQQCAMLYVHDRVFFNDFYGISCRNATDGSEIWYTWLSRENLAQGLTYAYNRIYTVTEARCLYVLDEASGEKLSYYDQFGSQMHSMPSLSNGFLYVGCRDWNVYCFGEDMLMEDESAPSASISSEQVWSSPIKLTETAPITAETVILAVISVACIIGTVSFWTLRKRK